MVTDDPTTPLVGDMEVIVGVGGPTVNEDPLVPVPPELVTVIAPVVAVAGTVAVICVAEFTVKEAVTPLNLTELAPVKFVPVRATAVPDEPLVGVNETTVGAFVPVRLMKLWT
jgi:hypothetical protein